MYLIFSTMSRLLLGFIIFAVLAHSARATNESFIYPGVSKPSVANVSDVSVYRNDSMIVEYNQFGYTTHLSMSMNCFDSQTSALAVNSQTSTASGNVYQFGPYENTGLVKWSFSNGYLRNQTYCRFLLYNQSLASCTWAPWDKFSGPPGTVGRVLTPFAYSPVFRLFTNATSSRQPTLWTRNATATQKADASKTISTTQAATCPPSGIPPSPIPTVWAVERWPPLGDGLEFPFDPKMVRVQGLGA